MLLLISELISVLISVILIQKSRRGLQELSTGPCSVQDTELGAEGWANAERGDEGWVNTELGAEGWLSPCAALPGRISPFGAGGKGQAPAVPLCPGHRERRIAGEVIEALTNQQTRVGLYFLFLV